MKKLFVIIMFFGIVMLFSGKNSFCFEEYANLLNYEELLSLISNEEKLLLINATSEIEYDASTIQGSVNISAGAVKQTNELPGDKNSFLIFFGQNREDERAHIAAGHAQELGYVNVHVYKEGLFEWIQRGNNTGKKISYDGVEVQLILPVDLKSQIESKNSFYLLDIRDKEQFAQYNVNNSINFPLENLGELYSSILKDAKIVVIDEDGSKSLIAGQFLKQKGFLNVLRLDGGVVRWKEDVKEVVKEDVKEGVKEVAKEEVKEGAKEDVKEVVETSVIQDKKKIEQSQKVKILEPIAAPENKQVIDKNAK